VVQENQESAMRDQREHVAFDRDYADRFLPIIKDILQDAVRKHLKVVVHTADFKLDTQRATGEAMQILAQVGLSAKADEMSGGLTQVDMRKLELARAIAAKPALLIADESMAGLSASEVDDILALLLGMKERGVAVIMIEHVMRAVMKFSERIAVLVAGRKIADGDPKTVVADREVVKAYLGE